MDKRTERAVIEAYDLVADRYAAEVETKPHNAYYDRPGVMSLWPDVTGLAVLDVGCGPGVYAELLLGRGATVTAGDASVRMLELAAERLRGRAKVIALDLSEHLPVPDQAFDLVNAPLCMDGIRDWRHVFSEYFRVLKPGGVAVVSAGHPAFDAEYFRTEAYFETEAVSCEWKGFGEKFLMHSYRRPLAEFINPPLEAGFQLERLLEPLPTDEFKDADPQGFAKLIRRPSFLMMRVRKPA
jgi:SAM-dependent methyltransferase